MSLPYSLIRTGSTLYDNLREEIGSLTDLLLETLPLARVDLHLHIHILDLHLIVSRAQGKEIVIQKLTAPYEPTGENRDILTGDCLGFIDYRLHLVPHDSLRLSRRERTWIANLVETHLEVQGLKEQLLWASWAMEAGEIAFLVFDRTNRIIQTNRAGDRILADQTEDLLALPLDNHSFVPLVTYLSSLEPGNGSRRLFLTNGARYIVQTLQLTDPLHGLLRIAILNPLETVDFQALNKHLTHIGFTRREREVIGLLMRGLSNRQIAAEMQISPLTVKDHLNHIFRKAGVTSRSQLLSTLFRMRPDG